MAIQAGNQKRRSGCRGSYVLDSFPSGEDDVRFLSWPPVVVLSRFGCGFRAPVMAEDFIVKILHWGFALLQIIRRYVLGAFSLVFIRLCCSDFGPADVGGSGLACGFGRCGLGAGH